jgi:toxin ParE1/3/4
MGWHVILTEPALADLENIVAFIATSNPAAATGIGSELVDAIFSLDLMPRRGARVEHRPDLRKLIRRDYLVVYQVDEAKEAVKIIRVWDSRRDPNDLLLPERNADSPAQGDGR